MELNDEEVRVILSHESIIRAPCMMLRSQVKNRLRCRGQFYKPSPCGICRRGFCTLSALHRHKTRGHNDTTSIPCGTTCSLCGEAFAKCWLLEAHMLKHCPPVIGNKGENHKEPSCDHTELRADDVSDESTSSSGDYINQETNCYFGNEIPLDVKALGRITESVSLNMTQCDSRHGFGLPKLKPDVSLFVKNSRSSAATNNIPPLTGSIRNHVSQDTDIHVDKIVINNPLSLRKTLRSDVQQVESHHLRSTLHAHPSCPDFSERQQHQQQHQRPSVLVFHSTRKQPMPANIESMQKFEASKRKDTESMPKKHDCPTAVVLPYTQTVLQQDSVCKPDESSTKHSSFYEHRSDALLSQDAITSRIAKFRIKREWSTGSAQRARDTPSESLVVLRSEDSSNSSEASSTGLLGWPLLSSESVFREQVDSILEIACWKHKPKPLTK